MSKLRDHNAFSNFNKKIVIRIIKIPVVSFPSEFCLEFFYQNFVRYLGLQFFVTLYPVHMQCNECCYQATNKGNLKTHQDSIHKGIRYKCKECDYQATDKGSLKTHQDFLHKGIRYKCKECY